MIETNTPHCYKLDIDTIRQTYVDQGYPFLKACGKAIAESKQKILNWIIGGGTVAVFFGAPGSGKSTFMSRLRLESGNLMMVEVSGLNRAQNVFLKKLPEVSFLMVWTPLDTCLDRIDSRKGKRLDEETGKEPLKKLARLWHERYNYDGTSNWKFALNPDRALRWVPNKE